jgi:hypothetical protein
MGTLESEEIAALLQQTIWGEQVVRALSNLRASHPNASFEIKMVEAALAGASARIETYLRSRR